MSNETIPDTKISSFSAPNERDIAAFKALSEDEKRAVLAIEIERGRSSGVSDRAMDDLWAEALRRSNQSTDHAL